VRFVWAILGVLYALLSIYVGYLFVISGTGEKLQQKGAALQAAPLLGGIALIILSIPLIWNCIRLATAKQPRY
jgi:hypothetical protein